MGVRDSGSGLSASHNHDSQSSIRCHKNHWTTVPIPSFPSLGFELNIFLYNCTFTLSLKVYLNCSTVRRYCQIPSCINIQTSGEAKCQSRELCHGFTAGGDHTWFTDSSKHVNCKILCWSDQQIGGSYSSSLSQS